MILEIVNEPLTLSVNGFAGTAANNKPAAVAFQLMDRMWQIVKGKGLKNKGMNIWVYEGQNIFAGVELLESPDFETGLEQKNITLSRFARYKHIGPYHLIGQVGQQMKNELISNGYEITQRYIEIYGHWNSDETKLETDLLMAIK